MRKSIQASLVELMTQSINKEMNQPNEASSSTQSVEEIEETQEELEQSSEDIKVETTAEELEAFEKVNWTRSVI